ncbi:hypothetical protein ACFLQ2_02445 [archaeon]
MRGQVSLEFMVVLAVFLAAMALWLTGVNQASGAITVALGAKQSVLAAERLASTINAVCVMGSGNSLDTEAYVAGNASVIYDSALVLDTTEKTVYCEFNDFTVSGKQEFTATNTDGFVEVTRKE